MNSPELLTAFEHCQRHGNYARDYERIKTDFSQLLRAGIREGLTSNRPDFGEAAGEKILEISSEREILTEYPDVYSQVIHHASLADIASCAIRKPQERSWAVPEPIDIGSGLMWTPECFLAQDGSHLRRVVLVSSWSDDRHYSEARGWFSLGEVCAYELPMKEAVVVLGQHREGKRHGHWSKAVLHPINKKLRFRRRSFIGQGFKESWNPIWREDHDEIDVQTWLQGMLDDGVLQDSLFVVDIPVPVKDQRERIRELARRKLDTLYKTTERPDQCLSVCDFPLPCPFRSPCHAQEEPSGRWGFVRNS